MSATITMLAPNSAGGTYVAADGTVFTPASDGTVQVPQGYFSQLQAMGFSVVNDVGIDPTSGRPTLNLLPGQPWFDSTLGIPIWRNASNTGWINASGTSV
jgi:hypothetical protein